MWTAERPGARRVAVEVGQQFIEQTRPPHPLHSDVLQTIALALTRDLDALAERRAYIRLELVSLEKEIEALAEVLITTAGADQPVPQSMLVALQSLKDGGRVTASNDGLS